MHEFCSVDPKRLYGAPLISVYDIQASIKKMQRGHDMGLKGAMVWQVPDPRLPFTSEHYEPLWAACAEAGAPVICHILTGHSYIKTGQKGGIQGLKDATNVKTNDSANTLFDSSSRALSIAIPSCAC
jgi:predicted TIM-barrel fold metal-dependent hydrolase